MPSYNSSVEVELGLVLTSQERALQPPSPALAAHYDLKYARFQELSARMGPLP